MKALMEIESDQNALLIERARDGDREAFDSLVHVFRVRLADSIRSWSRFRIGPPLDVEEVVQDTFVRAFGSLGRFEWDGADAFYRWLCGIAKRAIAQAAAEHRRSERQAESTGIRGVTESGPSPSRVARREERFERLESAVQQLRPEHREVVLLSRIEGLTMNEVAQKTGRPVSTVKYHLACALAELRARFGDTESLRLPHRRLERKENDDV